jgi:hypothetical protein
LSLAQASSREKPKPNKPQEGQTRQMDSKPLHFHDELLHFSFDLPAGWSLKQIIGPFGCIVRSEYGLITVRAGEIEDHLIEKEARRAGLNEYLSRSGFQSIVFINDE